MRERLVRRVMPQRQIDKDRRIVGENGENIMSPDDVMESHLVGRPGKRKREIKLLLEGRIKVKAQSLIMHKVSDEVNEILDRLF